MSPELAQLKQLSEPDFRWLSSAGQEQAIAPNSVLVQQGECLDRLLLILAGSVLMTITRANDAPQEVDLLATGSMVGLSSLLNSHPSAISATAIAPSKILSISHTKLTAKLRQDAKFAARFYHEVAAQLSSRLRGISAMLVRNQTPADPPLRKVLFLFAELNDGDISWMVETGEQQHLAAGTVLIRQGEPTIALHLLLDGTLSVLIATTVKDKPVDREVAKLATGEMVGEISFIDAQTASATVQAHTPCFVLTLPRAALMAKLQQDGGFAARFYRSLALLLVDRLQDRLIRYNSDLTYAQDQSLDQDFDDELDDRLLQSSALAGVRFDWLLKRLRG
jgi:bacteriocin-type transport-associated protein